MVRAAEFPDLPSRFDAAFVCRTIEDLEQFLKMSGRDSERRYAVTLVDTSAPTYLADCSLLDGPNRSLNDLQASARRYWSNGVAVGPMEILTTSSLRIERAI